MRFFLSTIMALLWCVLLDAMNPQKKELKLPPLLKNPMLRDGIKSDTPSIQHVLNVIAATQENNEVHIATALGHVPLTLRNRTAWKLFQAQTQLIIEEKDEEVIKSVNVFNNNDSNFNIGYFIKGFFGLAISCIPAASIYLLKAFPDRIKYSGALCLSIITLIGIKRSIPIIQRSLCYKAYLNNIVLHKEQQVELAQLARKTFGTLDPADETWQPNYKKWNGLEHIEVWINESNQL